MANSNSSYQPPQAILDETEIAQLRIQASQIQNSGSSSHKQQSREAGWLPTSAMGSGMDYAESREYQQGDDPRYINWRLSARSTETFVKTYHMESRPSLCVILDQRRSMVFGTRRRLKISQATRLAILLAAAAEQRNLTLNVLLINDQIQRLDNQHIDEFLQRVNRTPDIKQQTGSTDFQTIINSLQHLATGSLVYIISDFMDLKTSHNKSLLQLQEQYSIQALHVVDQAEKKLPKSGGVCLQAMNSRAKLTLDSNNSEVISNACCILDEHLQSIKQILMHAAIPYAEVLTDEDSIHQHILLPLGH